MIPKISLKFEMPEAARADRPGGDGVHADRLLAQLRGEITAVDSRAAFATPITL